MAYPYRKFRKPRLGTPLNKGHRLSKGLVGYWLMNEGCGTTNADVSGNGNIGTISGATWSEGKFGSCLSFDGNNDWVDISDSGLPAFGTSDFTVIIWAKCPRDDANRALFSKGGWVAGEILFYKHDSDKFTVYGNNGSINVAFGGTDSWPDDVWTQVAAVRSGSVLTVYQDTVKGSSDASAGADINTATDWRIGARDDGSRVFAGKIEYVMVYNRALSASEIALLYCEPFCMFEPTISPVFGSYYIPPVGNIGIMTTWGGYWGVTY